MSVVPRVHIVGAHMCLCVRVCVRVCDHVIDLVFYIGFSMTPYIKELGKSRDHTHTHM